jgi:hypothetical protein
MKPTKDDDAATEENVFPKLVGVKRERSSGCDV